MIMIIISKAIIGKSDVPRADVVGVGWNDRPIG